MDKPVKKEKKFDFHIVGKKGSRRIKIVAGGRKRRRKGNLTVDHIIPKSFLKELRENNTRMMSREENQAKGNRLTKEGIEKIFRLILKYYE